MPPVLSFDFVRSGDTDGSLLWSVQVELARKRKTHILQAHQTGKEGFYLHLSNDWYIKYKWWWWWWQWQWLHDDDHIDNDDDGDVCDGDDNDGRIVTNNAEYVDDDIDIGIDQDDKKKILIPWQSLISLLLRKCLERNKRAVPQDCSKQHANHWPREKYTANEIKMK